MENPNIIQLIKRRRLQAFACMGSAGQGALRAPHCMNADATRSNPAIANTISLFSEKVTSQGAAETRPAKVAPIPSVTKSAGRAQQISVPKLVKRLSAGRIDCFQRSCISKIFHYRRMASTL